MMISEMIGKKKDLLAQAWAGLSGGLLYLSYILSFAFLVPIQHVFSRRGFKSGLLAIGVALGTVSVGHIGRMVEMKTVEFGTFLSGILPPALLLGAISFINLPVKKLSQGLKICIAALALSLIALPFIMHSTGDLEFLAILKDYVARTIASSGLSVNESLYAHEAVDAAVTMVRSGFSAFILWILASNWYLGDLLANKARIPLREEYSEPDRSTKPLADLYISSAMVWPTLFSWTLLFIVIVTDSKGILSMIAWNTALWTASFYAVQGLGILSYLAAHFPAARLLRLFIPLALIILFVAPTAGMIAFIALPILGITEVWLPYRTIKGALK
jgi:hypothetical protein